MWGDQRVNCVLYECFPLVNCVLSTVNTLLCMALLCRAIQSSVQELTGERTVLFTYSSLPRW
ncbi:unnamed protein product [Staurois parvus]|uniref:Uncharacterized protein n=1 Tax=Staurois parvus TaxID=386267 RepID=A0ABN9BV63_9NEOB|nr:unnamed protein product [Staurois parvus]